MARQLHANVHYDAFNSCEEGEVKFHGMFCLLLDTFKPPMDTPLRPRAISIVVFLSVQSAP
jgi:hypothetical protein